MNAGETDIAIGDKNITFDDQISVVLNGTTLQKDTDYTLVYADNSWVGNAVVTIKGMGGFAGSVEKTVPIKADLSEAGIQVAIGDQQYTGRSGGGNPEHQLLRNRADIRKALCDSYIRKQREDR